MNTLLLRCAVEVEKTGSFTEAANNLYMAQPNLSKNVKKLESLINISIFERTRNGVIATPKGKEFLNYAKNILNEMDRLEEMFTKTPSEMQSLSLSVPRASYISNAFIQFVKNLNFEKEISIDYVETNSVQTIKNVAEGHFDLGVIRFPLDYQRHFMQYLENKNLKWETLLDFEFVVVFSKNHPLASKEVIQISDLNPYVEIVHGDVSIPYMDNHDIKNTMKNKDGKKIYIYERGSQFELLSQINESYMWVSPIPEEILIRHQLVQKKCVDEKHIYRDMLIKRNNLDVYKNQMSKWFLNEIEKSIKHILS